MSGGLGVLDFQFLNKGLCWGLAGRRRVPYIQVMQAPFGEVQKEEEAKAQENAVQEAGLDGVEPKSLRGWSSTFQYLHQYSMGL